jgi:hypothetical protein
MLDTLVAQVVLKRPGVAPIIGQQPQACLNMCGCTGNENLAASPSRAIILR